MGPVHYLKLVMVTSAPVVRGGCVVIYLKKELTLHFGSRWWKQ